MTLEAKAFFIVLTTNNNPHNFRKTRLKTRLYPAWHFFYSSPLGSLACVVYWLFLKKNAITFLVPPNAVSQIIKWLPHTTRHPDDTFCLQQQSFFHLSVPHILPLSPHYSTEQVFYIERSFVLCTMSYSVSPNRIYSLPVIAKGPDNKTAELTQSSNSAAVAPPCIKPEGPCTWEPT